MHAGKEVAVDDVVAAALDDHLLVCLDRTRLDRRDEGRADVGKVGAHRERGEYGRARSDRAAQRQGPVEPFTDFLHQRHRVLHTGVTARAGGHRNQAVGALFDRLVRKGVVDDVVQHHTAPAVHRIVEISAGAERRDDDRHLVLGAEQKVGVEPVVALVHDLVDGVGRGRPSGCARSCARERFGDLGEPLVEHRRRTRVERRHRTDHPRGALRDHEFRVADDEQRRADDGQGQALKHGGQGHETSLLG